MRIVESKCLRDLVVTKSPKKIVLLRIIFLDVLQLIVKLWFYQMKMCVIDCLVYHFFLVEIKHFFILVKKNDKFFCVIDVICNLNQ
jgi:hypothetical protein